MTVPKEPLIFLKRPRRSSADGDAVVCRRNRARWTTKARSASSSDGGSGAYLLRSARGDSRNRCANDVTPESPAC